jgi:hypothetical protein
VCSSTEMDAPSASHLGTRDHGPKIGRSRPRSVPVNAEVTGLRNWQIIPGFLASTKTYRYLATVSHARSKAHVEFLNATAGKEYADSSL